MMQTTHTQMKNVGFATTGLYGVVKAMLGVGGDFLRNHYVFTSVKLKILVLATWQRIFCATFDLKEVTPSFFQKHNLLNTLVLIQKRFGIGCMKEKCLLGEEDTMTIPALT